MVNRVQWKPTSQSGQKHHSIHKLKENFGWSLCTVYRSSCPLKSCAKSMSIVKPFSTSPIAQPHFSGDCTDKSLTTIYIFVSEGDSLQLNSLLRNSQFLWATEEFLPAVFPNLPLRLLTLFSFSITQIKLY